MLINVADTDVTLQKHLYRGRRLGGTVLQWQDTRIETALDLQVSVLVHASYEPNIYDISLLMHHLRYKGGFPTLQTPTASFNPT